MPSRSTITKLKVILIIDILIVAFAIGGYFYVSSSFEKPESAAFVLSDLNISPTQLEVGQQVTISVNVTNIGTAAGEYTATLAIDNLPNQNQTVPLQSGESTIVTFELDSVTEGTHSITIGELTGSFQVNAPPPVAPGGSTGPATSNIGIYSLKFNPLEGWPGTPLSITAEARNSGDLGGNVTVSLYINDALIDTKTIIVPSGITVLTKFSWTPPSQGTYSVRMTMPGYTLTGNLKVVPTGTYTLSISAGNAKFDFTIDGQGYTTPFSAPLATGPHTIVMPMADPNGKYTFTRWSDGSTSPSKQINLNGPISLTVVYTGSGGSCPSLYVWNGTEYVYMSEISNHGWLGYINYMNSDGSIVFWRNDPGDYVKLDKNILQPVNNGYFDMTLVQRSDEMFYLDSAYMYVVDHPSDVNVYSSAFEQYIDPNFKGQLYTVSKNPLTPISAVNEKGENVLPLIAKSDGVFTPGFNGLLSPSWDNITWNRLTLDLGNLAGAPQIKLIVQGVVDWGTGQDYTNWLDKFFAQPVPDGTQITPQPYMEVKAANGSWVRVPESRQFPLPPDDVVARTWVVDLTGLFPTNDYSLRISGFWNVTYDYFGVDITPNQTVTIQKINPQATLFQSFKTASVASGNFTKYGDVTPLVLNSDDEFVIGKHGDAVNLQFPIGNLAPPAAGMERDYFLIVSAWFKDPTGNWGFGFGFTVDPLPFHDMSGFPYPLDTESYPYDAAHLSYLQEWNTRVINPP